MTEFERKSDSLFKRFTERVAKTDLKIAVALPAMVGALTVLAGMAVEAHGQSDLLIHGGQAALNAYRHFVQSNVLQLGMNPDSLSDLVEQGVKGHLVSFGGNTQLRGFALMTAGTALTTAGVLCARGLSTVRERILGLARHMPRQRAETQGEETLPTGVANRPAMRGG